MAMFSLRSERFCAVRSKDKERESRTAQKMVQVKEREEGGEERKETLADPRILKTTHLTCHA